MDNSYIRSVIFRYVILIVIGLGNLFIFYTILTPLTVYPAFAILDNIYGAELLRGNITHSCDLLTSINSPEFITRLACMNTTIFFKGYFASIVPACIAGSAYYLLLILNLATPMGRKKRVYSLIFLLLLFLGLNITRITLFASIFASKGFDLFNLAHAATWYFGSTVLVIIIWFLNAMLFKINNLPIYTDIKILMSGNRQGNA